MIFRHPGPECTFPHQAAAWESKLAAAGSVEALLGGESALGREILRDFINATIGSPALAERTGIHVKTFHQMFGPKVNPTAAKLFNIIACLQEHEGVRLQVVA